MSIPEIQASVVGSGYPVVLLHPFPLSNTFWSEILPLKSFQFILPNFPGFGNSPIFQNSNLQVLSQSLNLYLKNLGLNREIALGGISMGGYWAMEYFRQFPDRINGLVLISTRAGLDTERAREERLKAAERAEKEGSGYLADTLLPRLLGKTALETKPLVVERVRKCLLEAPPLAVASAQRAMAQRRDQMEALKKAPQSLLMAGSEDILIPAAEMETMARLIPRAQFELFVDAGHLLPLESPENFLGSLEKFLTGLS